MKKFIIFAALALAFIGGTAVVMTVHPHQAYAECGGTGC